MFWRKEDPKDLEQQNLRFQHCRHTRVQHAPTLLQLMLLPVVCDRLLKEKQDSSPILEVEKNNIE
ncbi:Prolyl oligopeptidase family protein [Zea mays]|uniref:Prolyl oligopeptidase family protein n=1 Tax=Zea mays TaxID=4577 RepID=B4FNV3_MAIZE|nr:unknown [Zea mays]ONM15059.1 Prolyl oligopeptidase family protein [Zea mays]